MKSIRRVAWCLLTACLMTTPLFAEERLSAEEENNPQCHIRIRALTASQGSGDRQQAGEKREITTPAAMADMKSELQRLPFTSYNEVTTVEGTTPLREGKFFTFEDDTHATHRVTIIPHGLVSGAGGKPKISFSINWRGPGNAEYLHTKLGFENGKNMLVGADQSSGSPLVLCVTVRCFTPGGGEAAEANSSK